MTLPFSSWKASSASRVSSNSTKAYLHTCVNTSSLFSVHNRHGIYGLALKVFGAGISSRTRRPYLTQRNISACFGVYPWYKPFKFISEISRASFWVEARNIKSCSHSVWSFTFFFSVCQRKEIGGDEFVCVFLFLKHDENLLWHRGNPNGVGNATQSVEKWHGWFASEEQRSK